MLKAGKYKVLEVLDVSKSLLTQLNQQDTTAVDECEERTTHSSAKSIQKALLECTNGRCVAYFVDLPELGRHSEICIDADQTAPLLNKMNTRVLLKKSSALNHAFVEKLFKENKRKVEENSFVNKNLK